MVQLINAVQGVIYHVKFNKENYITFLNEVILSVDKEENKTRKK